MKQILAILLAAVLIIPFTGCEHGEPEAMETDGHVEFSIDGSLENADSMIVLLDERVDGEWINVDSAEIVDGKFRVEGTVDHARLLYLRILKGDDAEYVSVFVEGAPMELTGDMESPDDIAITGSASQDLLVEFNAGYEKYYELYDSLYTLQEESEDQMVKDSLGKMIAKVEDDAAVYLKEFVAEHSGSQVAPYLALRHMSYEFEYDELEPVVANIKREIAASKYLDDLDETLAKLKELAIGKPAPDFSQESPEGESVSLSSLSGKYVLVDFWASWCGPCRRENPNVVAMYEQYGGEDFEIIGVSLDKNREKWLKAIEDDKLTWVHVSDLQGWKNEVADLYNVKAIPSTYLLDKDGTILAKNIRGEELRDKVRELVGSPS